MQLCKENARSSAESEYITTMTHDKNLLELVNEFKSMLQKAEYNVYDFSLEGSLDQCSRASLRFTIGKFENVVGRKRVASAVGYDDGKRRRVESDDNVGVQRVGSMEMGCQETKGINTVENAYVSGYSGGTNEAKCAEKAGTSSIEVASTSGDDTVARHTNTPENVNTTANVGGYVSYCNDQQCNVQCGESCKDVYPGTECGEACLANVSENCKRCGEHCNTPNCGRTPINNQAVDQAAPLQNFKPCDLHTGNRYNPDVKNRIAFDARQGLTRSARDASDSGASSQDLMQTLYECGSCPSAFENEDFLHAHFRQFHEGCGRSHSASPIITPPEYPMSRRSSPSYDLPSFDEHSASASHASTRAPFMRAGGGRCFSQVSNERFEPNASSAFPQGNADRNSSNDDSIQVGPVHFTGLRVRENDLVRNETWGHNVGIKSEPHMHCQPQTPRASQNSVNFSGRGSGTSLSDGMRSDTGAAEEGNSKEHGYSSNRQHQSIDNSRNTGDNDPFKSVQALPAGPPSFIPQDRLPDGRIPCQFVDCDQTFGRRTTARRHFFRKRKFLLDCSHYVSKAQCRTLKKAFWKLNIV